MLELLGGSICAVPAGDHLVPFEPKRDVDRGEAVEPASQLGRVDPRAGRR